MNCNRAARYKLGLSTYGLPIRLVTVGGPLCQDIPANTNASLGSVCAYLLGQENLFSDMFL